MGGEEKIIAGPRFGHKGNRSAPVALASLESPSRKGKWLLSIAACFCLAAAIAWSWIKYQNVPVFPIQNVKINGVYPHVNHALLQQTILPFTQHGLLTMDASSLRDRLQQLPWVNTVNVQRAWPHTLAITLTEQKPVARFNNQALLSEEGILFTIGTSEVPAGLPLFTAPQGQQALVLQNYQQMAALLKPLALTITVLTVDDRQAWRLQLANGLVLLLGREQPLQRLQRFVAAYPQLVANKAAVTINYIDLRYANGMAVNFKNQA
jgi:cell division protein FtsQ